VLDESGFQGARLLDRSGSEEYAAKLAASTNEAAERGVFGSPTMFVDGEMFFGNGRLDFVARAMRGAVPA
jgi:2-hydroxychromene-2-carboxylate isomerase